MSQITFRVDYAQSMRRGVNCPVPPTISMEVDVSALAPATRDIIAARLNSAGDVCALDENGRYLSLRVIAAGGVEQIEETRHRDDRPARSLLRTVTRWGNPCQEYERPELVTAAAPTVAALIEAIAAEDHAIATYAQRQADAAAAVLAKARKLRLDEMASSRHQTAEGHLRLRSDGAVVESYRREDDIGGISYSYDREYIVYYSHGYSGLTPEEDTAYRARHDQLDAETLQRKEAAWSVAAAELRRLYWQPRLDWISQHGSKRLQRLVTEGIPHAKTYDAERAKWEQDTFAAALAAELPGWYLPAGEVNAVADVGMRSLSLLDAARAIAPDAKLGKDATTGRIVAWTTFRDRIVCWPQD